MDNYRQPMYSRYNRNMSRRQGHGSGGYQNTPVMDAGSCGHCNDKTMDNCIDSLPLAMAYVPMQKWRKVSDASEGLNHGTIFQELILPYCHYHHRGMRGDR